MGYEGIRTRVQGVVEPGSRERIRAGARRSEIRGKRFRDVGYEGKRAGERGY